MKKHLAGIIPVSGIESDFNMPWHASLMPIAPNYLAIERSVAECAHAGCNTIWIVCSDDVTPLIRYQVGEIVQDPVYNYRHFERNKQETKKPIRIYYVPIKIRDINKRDNLVWSAIHGALTANKLLADISTHLRPDKFWVSWPYGYYKSSLLRLHRKDILENNVMLAHEEKTARNNLYLGLTLDMEQIEQLRTESRTRSSGLWVDPMTREEKYSLDKRYSYRKFDLKKVFETLEVSNYIVVDTLDYHPLDSWKNYCDFLSQGLKIQKPKILRSKEWNQIGYDED